MPNKKKSIKLWYIHRMLHLFCNNLYTNMERSKEYNYMLLVICSYTYRYVCIPKKGLQVYISLILVIIFEKGSKTEGGLITVILHLSVLFKFLIKIYSFITWIWINKDSFWFNKKILKSKKDSKRRPTTALPGVRCLDLMTFFKNVKFKTLGLALCFWN